MPRKRLWLTRVVTVALLAATTTGMAATAAQADSSVAIAFTVSDGESPEVYVVHDPNCAPDITCKPRRYQGVINFVVSTNVSLNGQTLTVVLETVNGTAVAPGDYCPTTRTVSFPPGDFDQVVPVCINFSTATEPTETFTVRLKNPSVPAAVSDTGIGTIFDGIEHVY